MSGTAVPSSVTVSGTTLYALATAYYGDPTLWTAIAQANGLSDPWIGDVVTLTLPRPEGLTTNGGILGDP